MQQPTTNDFAQLLAEALKLSDVGPGTRAILLSNHVWEPRAMGAYETALNMLEADWLRLVLPPKTNGTSFDNPVQPDSFALDMLKASEIVIHPTTTPGAVAELTLYVQAVEDVLTGGTRWWDCSIGGDEMALRRLFPTPDLIERTRAGAARMENARTIRVTSRAGTDLTMSCEGRIGHYQVGLANVPGRWTNFGFGLVATAPVEDSVNGTLVYDGGDSLGRILGSLRALLPERVTCTFEDGNLVRIEGGAAARLFERYLHDLGRPEHYRVAHVGWGTHKQAVWGGPGFTIADWESYYGNVMIHFGQNVFATPAAFNGLHGTNKPSAPWPMPAHSGGCVLNHSLYLDDELIVEEGKIVPEGLR